MSSLGYNILSFIFGPFYTVEHVPTKLNFLCKVIISTGTFLNNYDVTDRKLKPLPTYSTLEKQEKYLSVDYSLTLALVPTI